MGLYDIGRGYLKKEWPLLHERLLSTISVECQLHDNAKRDLIDTISEIYKFANFYGYTFNQIADESKLMMSKANNVIVTDNNDNSYDAIIVHDSVNHPIHYNNNPSGVECIDVIRHMMCNQANAIKYLWRMNDKGDPIENLEKAKWYIEDEIKRLKEIEQTK